MQLHIIVHIFSCFQSLNLSSIFLNLDCSTTKIRSISLGHHLLFDSKVGLVIIRPVHDRVKKTGKYE